MSEETSKILDMLAERYGTTAEMLLREIIRRGLVTSILGVVISSIALCFGIFLLAKGIKMYSDDSYSDWEEIVLFLGGALATVSGIIWVINLINLVVWIVSPNAQAVITIMSIVKH